MIINNYITGVCSTSHIFHSGYLDYRSGFQAVLDAV